MKNVLSLLALILISFSTYAQNWSRLGPGNNHGEESITSICADKFGNVYAIGVGWGVNVDAGIHNNVFKWDGTSWNQLGTGTGALNSLPVPYYSLSTDTSGNVYVVGADDSMNYYVAMWNGTLWSKLGGTFSISDSPPIALCFDRHDNLFAVCGYTDSALVNHSCLKKWNGISWTQIDTGTSALQANNEINTIVADSAGNLYTAGMFTDGPTGNTGNICVKKWDGTSWTELGAGVAPQHESDYEIFSLLTDTSGNVYAAGYFLDADSAYFIAKWDGTSWSELGGWHPNYPAYSLCWDPSGNLYAGGDFNDTSKTMTYNYNLVDSEVIHPNYVAKWDGTNWSQLNTGANDLSANGRIFSICSDPAGNIYAGGAFTDTTVTNLWIDSSGGVAIDTYYYHPCYVAKYTNPALSVTPLHATQGINIYPNPTQSIINVRTNSNASADYLLYDCTGKVCRSGKLKGGVTSVDIASLPSGTYLFSVSNDLGTYRVVKE